VTSFSDAIVNGFQIAAKLREQDMQERKLKLDEDFRQAEFAERKRTFGLDYDLRNRALESTIKQGEQLLGEREAARLEGARQFDESLKIDKGRLALDQHELDMKERTYNDTRFDQRAAAVGGALSDYTVMGGDEQAQVVANTAIGDHEVNRRLFAKLGMDPNTLTSAKDGTPLTRAVVRGNKVLIYGVRKNAEGKSEPVIMDQGRTADNSTPPLEIDRDKFIETVTGVYGNNPYFLAEYGKGATLAGLKPKGTPDTLEAVAEAATRAVSQREASAQPPAAAPAPGLDSAPAAQPATPVALTTGERAGGAVRNYIADSTRIPRAVLGFAAESSKRAAGDMIGGTVDFVRGLAGTDPRASVAQAPAPAGGGAPTAPGARGAEPPATGQAEDSAPAPRALSAEEAEWKNLQRQYVYNRGLGATISAGDVESGRVTGIGSETLANSQSTIMARQNEAIRTRLDEMSSRHSEMMKSLLPAGSGDSKYMTEELRSRATQDASLLTEHAGAHNFAKDPQLESAAMSALAQINQMANGDSKYARELRNNPELRVSAAWATVNPGQPGQPNKGIPMNDPSFEAAIEKVGTLYRSRALSVGDATKALLEYYDLYRQESAE